MNFSISNYVKAHHISRAALTVGVVVAAIVFFVVGICLRLLVGPLSLDLVHSNLSEAIREALPGITLDYKQAAVEWSRDQGKVNLVILGARMFDNRGRIVALAPKADIDLAAAPFLQGRFEIRRITLVDVQLNLVRMKSGAIRLGVEKDLGSDDVIARLSNAIRARGSNNSTLESFSVSNARLAIYDEDTGLFLVAPRAMLSITSKKAGIGAEFDANVEISGKQAHLKADFTLPPGKAPVTGSLAVTGLDLRALGSNAKMFSGLKNVALTAGLSSQFTVTPDGHILGADFDLEASGEVPLTLINQKALHVTSLRLAGHYDGGPRRLVLDSANLQSREALVRLKGAGQFLLDANGRLEKVRGDLSFGRMALDMPGLFARPVGLESVSLAGDYLVAPRRFEATRFKVTAPSLALESSGTLTLAGRGQAPGLTLNGKLAALPVRQLLRYWPLPMAPGARDWLDSNIFAGTVGPMLFEANFPPGLLDQDVLPDNSMKLSFAMQGVEGNYLRGLTHVTDMAGEAVLTGDTFTASFSGGRIGPLTASAGKAVIPNLHVHGTTGDLSVHIDGAMPDVMALIDMKPLNYPTRFGIDPRETKGTVSADLDFKVPMLKDAAVDAVGISVHAAASDFGVLLGSHTRISNGAVNFDIDNSHLHQVGTVSLADARLAVDWTEDFDTADPITTKLSVKGNLTEGARAMLNIGLSKILTGTAPIVADIRGHRGSLRTADVQVDLTPVTLTAPVVNLEKPAGGAAAARLAVNFGPGDEPQDETIRITGPLLTASGTASFGKAGELTQLNLTSIKMGSQNDLSLVLTRSAAGDDYVLRGHSLDGSKLGHPSESAAAGTAAAPRDDTPDGHYHINAKLDRVALRQGVAIAPFNLDLAGNGERLAALSLSGSLVAGAGKPAPLNASLETTPATRKVTVTAGDAGLLARGMFAFDSMKGGQLTLNAVLPGHADAPGAANLGPDYQGNLTVRDFKVMNQPALARLFSAGSLTGMSDLLQGQGITADHLEMPFTSKNNVISVHDAWVTGPAVGASADGYIDRPKGMIALKGSMVPAYGLNSVLGNIPLLGDVLISKKGEGILGVTYSATGRAEQPDISVNPLSMLTPGIFRRIFEGRMPNAANAPSNVQNNAQNNAQAAQANPKPN